ncbi:hypothetical protein ACFQZZ_04515 [Nocardia sp. GCM10030253]|uniref:hypothetical protein n=1 Tax=Nocardia sp. GCM10030253 TaxID=3273404 RepID=UPI00362CBC0E
MADNAPGNRQVGRESSFADLSQLAQLIAQFVAPATLLAGLLYYWGFFHAKGFCAHFGVESTSLGLSTTDYVMRSADGLFVPLATYAVAALAVMWGRVALPQRLREGHRPRWLMITATVVATLLLLNGLSQLSFETPMNRGLGVAPFCVITGVLLLWAVVRARRRQLTTGATTAPPVTTPLEWVLVFLLVAGSFFWGATAYSLAVGKGRAIKFERSLPSAAVLTLYTEKALDLNVGGVRKAACTDPGSAYRYRYDGLVLVMSTSENYVILPRTWTYKQGTAIVLPRNGPGAHRLEFARSVPDATPPAC